MALQDLWSGDFSTSNQYVKYDIEMIENWTDTPGNLSNITVRVWAWRTNTYGPTYGTGTCYVTIAGSQYTSGISSSQKIGTTKILLFEKNVNIAHNGDGTGRVDIYAYISMDVVSSSNQGWGFGLTTIARASQPSLSASTADMGTAITIYMNRADGSFTHTVKYSFGSDNGTIATGVTDSVAWTLPLTLANQIPSAASGWGTIIVDTYSGGTLIGTKSVTFTANCPASMVPTFTSVTHSEANSNVSGKAIGSYVQGLSQLAMVINGAAGTYGSSISKYDFTVDGTLYSVTTNTATSNALTSSGSITLTATITDSRGRTATKTATITILAYSPPSITAFTIARCDSNGNLNSMGDYVKVTRSGTWSVLGTKNTCSILIKTSPRGANTWTTKNTTAGGTGGSLASSSVVISTYAATSSFDFRLEFTDLFNTTISLTVLSTGIVTMSWSPTGVGIGKVWQQGALDVSGDVYTDGKLFFMPSIIADRDSTEWHLPLAIQSDGGAVNITSDVDWNTIKSTGIYRMNSSLNSPIKSGINPDQGRGWWYLQVIVHDSSWGIQIAFDYRDGTYIRRWWDNSGTVTWDTWRRITDERRDLLGADGSGQNLSPSTWNRATWSNVWADEGIIWQPGGNSNMFGVKEKGWYEVFYSIQLQQSINTPFYAQVWGNASNSGIISQWTTNNGWNLMQNTVFVYMNPGTNYEIVIRQEDGGYTRGIDNQKMRVKRL